MLRSVAVQNFKRHDQIQANFDAGLNLITGPNFSGKTSLLQAIQVAFFGLSALPGGAAVAQKRGTGDNFEIAVAFDVDGVAYRVTRGPRWARLSRDGVFIAHSASAVSAEIQKLIGLDRRRFCQIKVVQQKHSQALLSLGGGELHNLVEQITGADVIQAVIGALKDEKTKVSAKAELLAERPADIKTAKDNVKQANEYQSQCDNARRAAQQAADNTKSAYDQIDAQLTQARADNAAIETTNGKREQLTDEARHHKATIERLRGQAPDAVADAEIQNAKTAAKTAKRRADTAKTLFGDWQAASRRISQAKRQLAHAKAQRDRHEKDIVIPADMRGPQTVYESALTAFDAAKTRLSQAKQALSDGLCPTCKRPFARANKSDLENRFETARVDRDEKQRRLDEAKAVIDDIKCARQRYQTACETIAGWTARLEAAEGERADAADAAKTSRIRLADDYGIDSARGVKNLEDTADAANATVNGLQAAQNKAADIRQQIDAAKKRAVVVDAALADLGPARQPADIGGLESQYRQCEQARDTAAQALAAAQQKSSRADADAKAADAALQQAQTNADAIAVARQRLNLIEQLTRFLKTHRDRFLSDIWARVMAQASGFAQTCTGGAIEAVSRNDDGKFVYIEDGHTQPVEAASGAQASIMGLGVQLALSQMLPSGFNALLLDEPGADCSDDIALAMTMALNAAGGQIVMVSHRHFDAAPAAQVNELEL